MGSILGGTGAILGPTGILFLSGIFVKESVDAVEGSPVEEEEFLLGVIEGRTGVGVIGVIDGVCSVKISLGGLNGLLGEKVLLLSGLGGDLSLPDVEFLPLTLVEPLLPESGLLPMKIRFRIIV